jgi:hypothetical protein
MKRESKGIYRKPTKSVISVTGLSGAFNLEIPMENYFAKLNSINVSEHIEKKGQFSYLSWPYAVQQLRQADPAATWEVRRFDGLPYLKTDCGHFVEVAVTVAGVTLSQIHPVLDGKNRPIELPNAFDINTSIQRCLVKAIALHGLGLYIYAGEDLPDGASNEQQSVPAEEMVNAQQIARIKSLLADTGQSLQRLLAFLRVDALDQIPASEFPRVVKLLERSKRRAA